MYLTILLFDNLSHCALKRHGKQLLRLNGKFHRELVDYILRITVDDESDGIFCGYSALVAVDKLILGNL